MGVGEVCLEYKLNLVKRILLIAVGDRVGNVMMKMRMIYPMKNMIVRVLWAPVHRDFFVEILVYFQV